MAFPWAFRSQICLAALAEAGNPFQRTDSLLTDDTRAATSALRNFRWQQLQVEGPSGRSPSRLRAQAGAWPRTVRRVSDRIGALLRDSRGPEAGGALNLQFTPVGVVVRGRDPVAAMLATLDRESQPSMGRVLAPGTGAMWVVAAASAMALTASNGAVTSPAHVAFYAALASAAETVVRGWPAHYDFGFRRHQRAAQEFLTNDDREGWLYDGDTVAVDMADVERRLALGSGFDHADLTKNVAKVSPVFRHIFGGLLYGHGRPTWVSWDRLLYRDPDDGEPRLVLFVRYFRERPAYPAPAPEPMPLLAPQRAPEAVLVY